jgi:hypothetical protein
MQLMRVMMREVCMCLREEEERERLAQLVVSPQKRPRCSKAADGEHVAHVGRKAQCIEHGQQVQQTLVVRIVGPAFDRNAVCCRSESAGCVAARGTSATHLD